MNKDRIAAIAACGEQKADTERFDIDHGIDGAPPLRRSSAQQAPGYLWNGTTQELIPSCLGVIPTTKRMRRSLRRPFGAGTERPNERPT